MQSAKRLLNALVIAAQLIVFVFQRFDPLFGLFRRLFNIIDNISAVKAAKHAGFEICAHTFPSAKGIHFSFY